MHSGCLGCSALRATCAKCRASIEWRRPWWRYPFILLGILWAFVLPLLDASGLMCLLAPFGFVIMGFGMMGRPDPGWMDNEAYVERCRRSFVEHNM